jgi:hypothetical protein
MVLSPYFCNVNRPKKILLIVLASIAGFLLLISVLAWLLGPKMKELAVKQINNYLTVPVSVKTIDFSLLRKFPYATVDLSDVSTKGSKITGYADPLLEAKHIYFQFSWFDVFKENIRLKRISIEEAVCVLIVDKNGKNNYSIFKEQKGDNRAFNLELEEIVLKNTSIRYLNQPGAKDYSFRAEDMNLKGLFSNDNYTLSGEGALFVERFLLDEVNYINNKLTTLKVLVEVNAASGMYTIRESSIRVAALDLGVDGFIRDDKEGATLDLKVKSKDAGLEELLSLIPGVYTEKLKNYDYEGKVNFDLHISGETGGKNKALIVAAFSTNQASLSPVGTSYTLKNIRFKGSYTNRISKGRPVERLSLNNLDAVLEGQPLSLSFLLEDFSNPYMNLIAKSKVNLEVLSRFYMPDTLASMSGELMVNAKVKGRTKDSGSWISEGTIQATNVSFKLKQREILFTDFNGGLVLQGNRLQLTNLTGKAAGSDLKLNGYFDNVYAFLLSSGEMLRGEATLLSNNLDLNELLEDKKQLAAEDTSYRLDFSDRISVNLGVSVGVLSFRKFQAWQLKGRIDIRNKILSTDDLSFKAFEGHLKLKGRIDASRHDSILIACDADVKKLDATELFTQLGNFGQEVIRDVNVKGKISATVQFASIWSKDLHCNLNKIYAKSKLVIEKGELINFQPMLLLSKYLKSADLKQIKFETLENQIEISNKTIFIPSMEIKSSVMDLTASGTHSFDNNVDYKLQLYLSQLFGKKVRNNTTEFGTIEDDGLGRMRIFLTMKGPLANPTIVYDRKGIEQKVTQDIKQEKQDLKKILNKEFGWFKKDTAIVKKPDNQHKKQDELELELETE